MTLYRAEIFSTALDTNIPLKHHPKYFQTNSRNVHTDMSLLSHFWLTCHISPHKTLKLTLFQMHLHDGAAFNIGHSQSPATRVCSFFYKCQEICVFPLFPSFSIVFLLVCHNLMQWCFSQSSYHSFRTEQFLTKNSQCLSSEGFLSSWKPRLPTCYTAVYICLLCSTVSGVCHWKVKLSNHWKSLCGNSAGKAEKSKEERQQKWKI